MDFLNELRLNNNREWFAANKARYVEVNGVFNDFAAELIQCIGLFDESVRGLSLRECTYRIYRDTRFSNDKTPYKTHFGVYACPGGKKSGNAGYYFHVEPAGGDGMLGYSMLDAGLYMPMPEVLRSTRDEIFDNGEAVVEAIKRAAEGGFALDYSNILKRTPKGYPAGSQFDELLRLKDFHVAKTVDDAYVLAPDLARRVAEDFRATVHFMSLAQRSAQLAHELAQS